MIPEGIVARILTESVSKRKTLRVVAGEFFARRPHLSYAKPVVRILSLGVARNYMFLDYLIMAAGYDLPSDPYKLNLARVLTYEVVFQGVKKPRLKKVASKSGLDDEAPKTLSSIDLEREKRNLVKKGLIHVAYSIPEWILKELRECHVPRLGELLESLLKDPVRWLRVSTHRISREGLVKRLSKRGIETAPDSDFEDMLRVVRGKGLGSTPEYKEGLYVVQDKASALVAHMVGEAQVTVDFTGAPGVKTTHLAQLGVKTSIAGDIRPRRAVEVKKLSRRLGLSPYVHVVVWDAQHPPLRRVRITAVVDPTCSNLGRLRYEPEIKMWLAPRDVEKLSKIQKTLLRAVLEALPKGVRVYYSVCSWSPKEAEEVVRSVEDLAEPSEPSIKLGVEGGVKGSQRLYPHIHETLGFFVVPLTRV